LIILHSSSSSFVFLLLGLVLGQLQALLGEEEKEQRESYEWREGKNIRNRGRRGKEGGDEKVRGGGIAAKAKRQLPSCFYPFLS